MAGKTLKLTCRSCGKEFDAGVQFDEQSFRDPTNTIENSSEQCPHCGRSNTYNKPDYHFR